MLSWLVVDRNPEEKPHKAEQANRDERSGPSPRERDERNDERSDDRADVRAGVENSRREGPLLHREPLGDDLYRRREISGLADAEREARDAEPAHRADERIADRRKTADDDRD